MTNRIVHHVYQDHANAIPPEHTASDVQRHTFTHKLHAMLDEVEQLGLSHIVSWQPHGRCFVVHKSRDYEKILPKFFKLTKISSFQRQLNLYGFRRITKGVDKGAYYHDCFLRGITWLTQRIIRVKVKGTMVRAKANPEEEPDFWSMSWVNPRGSCGVSTFSQVEAAETSSTTMPRMSLSLVSTGSQASLQSDNDEEVSSKTEESCREYASMNQQLTLQSVLHQSSDCLCNSFSLPQFDHQLFMHLLGEGPLKGQGIEDHLDRALASVNIQDVFDDFLINDCEVFDL